MRMTIRVLFLALLALYAGSAQAQTQFESYMFGRSAPTAPYGSGLCIVAIPGSSQNTAECIPGNALADLTSTQTLTNKSLSGSSNTFSNIPIASLASAPGLLSGAPNAFTGNSNQLTCLLTASGTPLSVTPSPTNCGGGWIISPLTGNTIINCPTGISSTSLTRQSGRFQIVQPSSGGPYGITLATSGCYKTPNGGAQLVTSTGPSREDDFWLVFEGGSSPITFASNAGGSNIANAASVTLIHHTAGTAGTGTGTQTKTLTFSVTTPGDPVTIEVGNFGTSNSAPAALTDNDSSVYTLFPGSFNTAPLGGDQTAAYLLQSAPSGTVTVTATWNSNVTYPIIFEQEWSAVPWLSVTDSGIASTFDSASASTLGSATNGATVENGQPVISFCNGGGTVSVSSPATLIDVDAGGSGHDAVGYWITPTVTQKTINMSQTAANADCSTFSFK